MTGPRAGRTFKHTMPFSLTLAHQGDRTPRRRVLQAPIRTSYLQALSGPTGERDRRDSPMRLNAIRRPMLDYDKRALQALARSSRAGIRGRVRDRIGYDEDAADERSWARNNRELALLFLKMGRVQ